MRKDRRLCAQRTNDRNLHTGIRDVVRAANDIGDLEVDVIHDAGQRIEEATILPDKHRVGERSAIHRNMALNNVLEFHLFMVESETPMWATTFCLKGGALLIRQLQGGPVVNRWQPSRKLALTAAVQFGSTFIGRVKTTGSLQLLRRSFIGIKAFRLPRENIVFEP